MKKLGDINRNRQELLRQAEVPGSDHNSRIWILKCRDCRHIYGSNGTDAFERKCPKCQDGREGLPVPAERDGEDWSREEHIIAFKLYNEIPFGTIHERNPKVIELAALLGRTSGSVSIKLANFARHDPALKARGIRGMPRGSKGELEIWRQFARRPAELAYESARLLAVRLGRSVAQIAGIDETDLPRRGAVREAIVQIRVNQSFFRKRVLSAYNYKCCVTGLDAQPLLVASHIVPWAKDEANRLNPRNGLCLNALHDRAFDRGLMWVDRDYSVRFSSDLQEFRDEGNHIVDWMLRYEGARLNLPGNFSPDLVLLKWHAEYWGRQKSTSAR